MGKGGLGCLTNRFVKFWSMFSFEYGSFRIYSFDMKEKKKEEPGGRLGVFSLKIKHFKRMQELLGKNIFFLIMILICRIKDTDNLDIYCFTIKRRIKNKIEEKSGKELITYLIFVIFSPHTHFWAFFIGF